MAVNDLYHEEVTTIAASPEAVYELVSDLPRMGEWSPENVGGRWIRGEPRTAGARFEGDNALGDRKWTVECVVITANPGECFEWLAGIVDPQGPYVRWTMQLEPADAGTKLTQRWNVMQLPPSLASMTDEQLAGRKSFVQAGMAETLAAIKATAES